MTQQTRRGRVLTDKEYEPWELIALTYPTDEQQKAKAVLRFLSNGKPTAKNGDAIEAIPDAPSRWPWEPRTPGHIHDEPVPECRWLSELLDHVPTPWWRRLWRWLDPRKQFRDWDSR